LREVMSEAGITQSELALISGVKQPSISQFLSGRTELSDDMLDRLLSCLGYRLEVERRAAKVEMTRSEQRSWRLHRQLATHLSPESLQAWRPVMLANLRRLRSGTRGQPHRRNLDRWQALLDEGDVPALRRVLTGLDRDSVAMREVSPLGGLLPQGERAAVLQLAGR
jgi:transcriptional regulator with XRE-family HTH domain